MICQEANDWAEIYWEICYVFSNNLLNFRNLLCILKLILFVEEFLQETWQNCKDKTNTEAREYLAYSVPSENSWNQMESCTSVLRMNSFITHL